MQRETKFRVWNYKWVFIRSFPFINRVIVFTATRDFGGLFDRSGRPILVGDTMRRTHDGWERVER